MGVPGSEHAAMGALIHQGFTASNGCMHVKAWHWHHAEKTHAPAVEKWTTSKYGLYITEHLSFPKRKPLGTVPSQLETYYMLPKGCESMRDCLFHEKSSGGGEYTGSCVTTFQPSSEVPLVIFSSAKPYLEEMPTALLEWSRLLQSIGEQHAFN